VLAAIVIVVGLCSGCRYGEPPSAELREARLPSRTRSDDFRLEVGALAAYASSVDEQTLVLSGIAGKTDAGSGLWR